MVGEKKVAPLLVCILLIITAFGGISLLTEQGMLGNVEAADTGAQPIVGLTAGTFVDTNEVDLQDIAWHPSGNFAVAVGLGGWVFRYEPNTGNWIDIDSSAQTTVDLRAVTWHELTDEFIVVGGESVGTTVWTTDGYSQLSEFPESPEAELYDVAADPGSVSVIVVGLGGACFEYDGTWNEITDIDGSNDLYGAIFNGPGFGYYFVGYNTTINEGVLWRYDLNTAEPIDPPLHRGWETNIIYGIDHDPAGHMIIVGQNNIDVYDPLAEPEGEFITDEQPPSGMVGGEVFRGVTWFDDTAYIVGENFGDGIFYQFIVGENKVSEIPVSSSITQEQYAIDSLPGRPNSIISVGDHGSDSAWQISQTFGSNDIITDTKVPHIQYIDLYETDDLDKTQRLNTQLDVNPEGSNDRRYTLEVLVTHETQDYLESVDVYAWFDDGDTGVNSDYPEVDVEFRTRAFNFRAEYDHVGKVTSFSQVFPTVANDPEGYGDQQEVVLLETDSSATYEFVGDRDEWTLEFVFALGPQVRWAAGQDGNFLGPEYSPVKDEALATPNTWDLHIHAQDEGGGHNDMWGEFGIFRFTSLTISGLPGTYEGMGAPGQKIELTPVTSSIVKYSANCDHNLYVYVQDDLQGEATEDIIQASDLSVAGGFIGETDIGGPGESHPVYLLGSGDPASYVPPRNMYDYSLTSVSTVDEEPTTHPEIRWWVEIPAVSEDIYSSNIVYVLQHSG